MSHDICHAYPLDRIDKNPTMDFMQRVLVLTLICVLTLLAVPTSSVQGQEPTPEPTPTATPAYLQEVTLTSGNTLLVERRISYGEASVVIALLVLWVTYVLGLSVRIPKEFLRR